MNDVLNHLEKAIDEMSEAAEGMIYLANHDDEIANNYIEIFTAMFTEMMAMYGLMYAESVKRENSDVSRNESSPDFIAFIISRFGKKQ